MKYVSVCSGIEAATVAWHPLGWEPVAFSEIEAFPSAVLAHHYPNVPNLGDMTKFKEWNLGTIDLLVGGTPCQSFSVAGLRKGLDDPRGNLMLTYLAIADKYRPSWLVWENVPGVLSSNGGRDFGTLLGGLGQLGYGFAYRILDAQYFGVAQRRRRVFVVGCLGNWRAAAAVLFERESLRGNSAPSRNQGQEVAGTIAASSFSGGASGRPEGAAGEHFQAAKCLTARGAGAGNCDPETSNLIPIALAENTIGRKPTNGGNGEGFTKGGPMYTLNATGVHGIAQPQIIHGTQDPCVSNIAFAQGRNNGGENVLQTGMAVRRLTPMECERLQGFPDGYTNIPWRKQFESPDGPRYKALGNSMAVPVMAWIGSRIQAFNEIFAQ